MKYNYYTYKSEWFSCSKCNWKGKGDETFLSDLSEVHTFRDVECPKCEEVICSFDLAKIEPPSENPLPDEKVCFNCENLIWMVGIGQGLKCRLTYNAIDNRRNTCDKFKFN